MLQGLYLCYVITNSASFVSSKCYMSLEGSAVCVCVCGGGGGGAARGGGGGGSGVITSHMEQFRDVPLEQVYFSNLRLYEKVSILAPSYINSPHF